MKEIEEFHNALDKINREYRKTMLTTVVVFVIAVVIIVAAKLWQVYA